MKVLKSNAVKAVLGLGVGAFFFYLFARKTDFHEIAVRLRDARIEFVFLSAVCSMIGFYFRALRWRYFLMPIKRIGIVNLFSAMSIGYMVSTGTPRLGELVRPYVLGMRENISKSAALATIVIERVFDLMSVLVLFTAYLLFFVPSTIPSSWRVGEHVITASVIRMTGVWAALFTLAAVGFLAGLRFQRARVLRITQRLCRILPGKMSEKVVEFTGSFADGLALFHSPRNLALAVFYSAVTWFWVLAAVWIMPMAFGLQPIPFTSVFFMMFLIAAGVSVPIPGAIGSFHFMAKAAFSMVSPYDAATIAGMVILLHVASVIPICVVGLVAFWREGLSFVFIKKASVASGAAGPPGIEARTDTTTAGVG